jgi:NADH dehydrogenase [ubiquinone] 1 alpha subcomplex assembly factor 7
MNPLKEQIIALIAQNGPLTIAQFMNVALNDPRHGYYATRPALGGEGDFITAPETSQMFGELIGLWCAQSWLEIGAPGLVNLIELGPGRGVMMKDALRAAKALDAYREALSVTLVEASAPLMQEEARTLAGLDISWAPTLDAVREGPSLIIANEFLDCMPIRQFVRTRQGWREKAVGVRDGALAFGLVTDPLPRDDIIPAALKNAPEGAIAEIAPALPAFIETLAARLRAHPGRALFFDYGAAETSGGDTFQALRRHASADPLDAPGEADLTAHVDFAEVKRLGEAAGLAVAGPISQGAWLRTLGIETRAAALQKAQPDKAEMIARQLARLTAPDQMGGLFNAICLSSAGLPPAAGFA